MLFPLGGISNKTIVTCNEGGYWAMYESDEHGFNNPKGQYKKDDIDIVLIGDSFAEGYCVKSKEDIGSLLRSSGLSTINLGRAGSSSLLELSILKEYTEPIKPRIVLWLYYFDMGELRREITSSLLLRYLNDEDFTQNLINRQDVIDAVLIESNEQKMRKENKTAVRKRIISSPAMQILKLNGLRKILKSKASESFLSTSDMHITFKRILKKAQKIISKWNGRFYFVFLTGFKSSISDWSSESEKILEIVREMDIPVINIHKEVFSLHPDPLSLFPLRRSGHYNAEGYRLVAETILKRIQEDNF